MSASALAGSARLDSRGGGCPYASLTAPLQHDSIGFMAKARYHYNIMLRPEPEGGYTALVPALPGCVTYGRTVDEAREMAKDAISGYIASLRKHKDPIPTDDNTLVASLDLEYAEVTRR
jgi:antitoxin HicB